MKNDLSHKLIVTAAITGSRISREQTPYIPITPGEISQAAIDAWKAGAAIVHIHVRDKEKCMGTQDAALYEEVLGKIKSETDVIINVSTTCTGARHFTDEERVIGLQFKPELASLDAGSMNLGGRVFLNAPETMDFLARTMKERGVKPELEIFELGMIGNCLDLLKRGLVEKPLHFQFVLGTGGGSPADARTLVLMKDMIPEGSTWSVAGIGRAQFAMATMAIVLGGHARVGMEDAIYISRGELIKSNAQLVEKVVAIANAYGREIATPDEAREILSLRG